ncbi:MAG: glycosyltransferase family 9 protein [Ignavibacteria bacterium]|jgi:heptosyltransferase-2|nr:glycosyltransferase family 9 protein [Ignavibacteria bacterium]MCU7502540.1 glycosyltransferase family 9 protein [Ignavibacteria bacterium]MCU7515257.1 glycosyltransferase family 9 protein [Ignavibacteria bacterium]
MKILIFALSGIGDALMFTPSIKFLRDAYPEAQIDAMVMFAGVRDIYKRNKYLDNVFYFDFLKQGAVKSLFYLLKFRKKYDVSVNVYPSNRKEYNLFSFFVGAKKRCAVDYLRKNRENLAFLNNVKVQEDDCLHNVEENIRLCEKLSGKKCGEIPGLEFFLEKEDNEFAEEYLRELKIDKGDLVIGFHPGSATLKNHINRRWEPEKFSSLGRRLIKELGAKVLIFGGPEERDLKNQVAEGIASEDAFTVEAKSLASSAAVMKRCSIFISNDSSLMHVASALKLNVIAVIGPTNPAYIYPWQTNHKIVTLSLPCAPCFYYSPRPLICYRTDVQFKCVKEISVDMVMDAAREMMGSRRQG